MLVRLPILQRLTAGMRTRSWPMTEPESLQRNKGIQKLLKHGAVLPSVLAFFSHPAQRDIKLDPLSNGLLPWKLPPQSTIPFSSRIACLLLESGHICRPLLILIRVLLLGYSSPHWDFTVRQALIHQCLSITTMYEDVKLPQHWSLN